jgi:hypothetical protein
MNCRSVEGQQRGQMQHGINALHQLVDRAIVEQIRAHKLTRRRGLDDIGRAHVMAIGENWHDRPAYLACGSGDEKLHVA